MMDWTSRSTADRMPESLPDGEQLFQRKSNGLVHDVFQQPMETLAGHMGVGRVRYPTAGTSSRAEAQLLYTTHLMEFHLPTMQLP